MNEVLHRCFRKYVNENKPLETAILAGHIRPGERIITEEIAQRLAVSKMPVREALRRLEAGGLISTRPNCGSTVTELSKENQKIINAVKKKDQNGVSKWLEADLTDSTHFVLSIFDDNNKAWLL